MAYNSKNITIILMDGTDKGVIKCKFSNWTGVIYRIPKVDLDLCKEEDCLKQSGVYFLLGESDETSKPVVYIGQAGARKNGEGILHRLQEHRRNPDKDFWSEAMVFTTLNNSFGLTEISYLENRFCTMANDAHRYIVKNINDPTHGNVTEEKESELEGFIEVAKMIIRVLGYKVFEPLTAVRLVKTDADGSADKSIEIEKEQPIFFIRRQGANAKGMQTAKGFQVLAGSVLRKEAGSSCRANVIEARREFSHIIDKNMVLLEDVTFRTPSAASNFVLLYSSNGNMEWVTEQGMNLGEFKNKNKGG